MVLVDRDGWEAERVQGGYRSAWQRNRGGKVRAVDLYSRVYDKENELTRARMVHLLSTANAAVSLVVVEAEVGYEVLPPNGP